MGLSDYFYYDETSPSCVRWAIDRYNGKGYNIKQISKGDVAGYLHSTGYYIVSLNSVRIRVHRIVFQLHNPDLDISRLFIDHKDTISSNNKYSNLRPVNQHINMRNAVMPSNNTTGFCGVTIGIKSGGKWYYTSESTGIDGKKVRKAFSINKYGLLPAFALACKHRTDTLLALNKQGAGYTINHGKPRSTNETS